jgi:Cu-Zn family superoxide dismutase
MRWKMALAALLSVGALGLLGASAAARPGADPVNGRRGYVRVFLDDAHGRRTAQVDIVALDRGGNLVTVNAWNLTRGFHGIHLHAIGICDPTGAKPFTSAGGHVNPTGQPEGMQAGAFPVLLAGATGVARTQFVDGNFRIGDLFGATGTAIVIHAAPDNYANIPARYTAGGAPGPDADTRQTGDAGTRVACGVLSPPKTKTA